MYQPTVSVIINTYNRCNHLKRLLDCLAHQSYENFEIIVVDGPSSDDTEKMLETYCNIIHLEHCDIVNLCKSRNIGICAASGEIVAFIDDDAVPENKDWIKNAIRYFEDSQVGIVSGAVYRINGQIEFQYGYFSAFGDNISVGIEPLDPANAKKGQFRGSAGGNVFFRKSSLLEVGGFDEYYAYYMDETDVSLRIQLNGYRLSYCNSSSIIHEAAPSVNRKTPYHLNWDIIARSRSYFTMKATTIMGLSDSERKKIAEHCCDEWKVNFKALLSDKQISKEDYHDFLRMLEEGQNVGIRDGLNKERQLKTAEDFNTKAFLPYQKSVGLSHMNLCLLCEDDVVDPRGGVPVYTKALASGLARRGHNVYIITRGKQEILCNHEGVNLCSVVPESLNNDLLIGKPTAQVRLDFSYACFIKLQQLKKSFFIDVVESPIWDSYGFVISYLEKVVPLVTRLQTPLKMVMETFQKVDSADLDMLMQYESALMEKSSAIITISDCVKDTIENLYDMKFSQQIYKNYLGISPDIKAFTSRNDDGKLVVFFIGRLERRKGIDSILAALPTLMDKYPNLEVRLAGDNTIYDEVIGDTYQHKLLMDNKGAGWLKRVHFLGKISDEQKEQEFADCDVFVSPSLYESFGIIFIEAMRYAKPVIGCKVGGMQEVIADNETGLLCQPNDADSFCECLDKLLADESLRKKMGKSGQKRLIEMFSEDTMCRQCEEIYREIINNY